MRVEELMIPHTFSLRPETTLRDAIWALRSHGLSVLPVTDNERLMGTVSVASVQARATEAGLAAGSLTVEQVMDREPAFCFVDEDVIEAEDSVKQELPLVIVVDRDKKVVGTVTTRELCSQIGMIRGPMTGSLESAAPNVEFDEDRVDYQSEESFPASDPPPGSSAQ